MPKFRYMAIDASGKPIRGVVDAASAMAVADRLRGQGQRLLNADELGQRWHLADFLQADLAFDRGLPKATIAHFTRELSVMLSAGQDIDRALRFLVESSENKRAQRILTALRDDVRGGKSLAAALAQHPSACCASRSPLMNLQRRAQAIGSLHFHDGRQRPAFVEVGFGRRVEAEQREPAPARHGRNPVLFKSFGPT